MAEVDVYATVLDDDTDLKQVEGRLKQAGLKVSEVLPTTRTIRGTCDENQVESVRSAVHGVAMVRRDELLYPPPDPHSPVQ